MITAMPNPCGHVSETAKCVMAPQSTDGHDFASRLDAEGQRRHVDQKQILAVESGHRDGDQSRRDQQQHQQHAYIAMQSRHA